MTIHIHLTPTSAPTENPTSAETEFTITYLSPEPSEFERSEAPTTKLVNSPKPAPEKD
jgi:hypothetical protein